MFLAVKMNMIHLKDVHFYLLEQLNNNSHTLFVFNFLVFPPPPQKKDKDK